MSQYRRFAAGGFPHSDISGLKPACGLPKLFAACHVLHRHVSPRHPPVALRCLITTIVPFLNMGCHWILFTFFRILSYRIFIYLAYLRVFSSTYCQRTKSFLNKPSMGPGGLEPPTPRLSSVCSNQLSYEPSIWWSRTGSNR